MCVACMLLSNIYSGFHCSKILGLIGILFFEKSRFELGMKIEKYQKSEVAILECVQFYDFQRFLIALYFKPVHSINIQTFIAF